jgi:tetratricopeptide (TPR) repeat protein
VKKHWNLIILLLVLTGGSGFIPVSSIVLPVQAQVPQNSELEAFGLVTLGQQQFDNGQTQKAISSWQQALQIYEELGDRYRQSLVLSLLGLAYHKLGEYQQSLEYFEQSLEIAQEFEYRKIEGLTLCGLGMAYSGLGQHAQTIEVCSQGLAIAREIGDRELEALMLPILVHAHFSLGQIQQGLAYLQQARNLQLNTEKTKINKEIF